MSEQFHPNMRETNGDVRSRATCIYCNKRTLDRCTQCGRFMCRQCEPEVTCGECEWQEYVRTQEARYGRPGERIPRELRCPACTGSGGFERYNEGKVTCPECHGTGRKEN